MVSARPARGGDGERPGDGAALDDGARARGFTLVEILIAMALFMVISAGVIFTVLSMSHAQAASAQVDLTQAGVRAAIDLIGHDVMMASGGARGGVYYIASGPIATANAIKVTEDPVTPQALPDAIELLLPDPSAQAYLAANYAGGNTISITSASTFTNTDYVLVTDLTNGTIFSVTSVTPGAPATLNVVAATNAMARASYVPGNWVFRMKDVTYAVSNTVFPRPAPLPAEPVLTMALNATLGSPTVPTAQPIVEGIEDFQIALGIDLNNDGNLLENGINPGDDEWWFNVAGEAAPASLLGWPLKTVRITLVGQAPSPLSRSALMYPARLAVEDRVAGAAKDQFPRRYLKSEFTVRNFNLQ